ncbi:MAG: sulfotransferase domain-containing protein [Isosphaeraceae bacterium]
MSDQNREQSIRRDRFDGSDRPAPRRMVAGGRAAGSAGVGGVGVGVAVADSETGRSPRKTRGGQGVDVICAGMYRACSTWQYEVVAHLLETHRSGHRLGYLLPDEYATARRNRTLAAEVGVTPTGGWTVFKSHDAAGCFAQAVSDGRARVVYAYRDVRDVVFSLMYKRSLSFEALLRQGMIHQVLANDRFWTSQRGVLIQRYDRILADPVGSVRELAAFLGITPEPGEAERIADEYSLESNRARTEALRRQLEQQGVDLNQASNALICDGATLLHWNHVRDGGSGSWYRESTLRQRRIFARLCGPWLSAHGYPPLPEGAAADLPSGLVERIGIERDILVGWVSYRIGAASRRWPRLASGARKMLRIGRNSRGGAVVWKESRPAGAE